jgi:hypothetical protein
VRSLHRTSVSVIGRTKTTPPPILAGLLATTSVWTARTFAANLRRARRDLDIGCCLEHGAFETSRTGDLVACHISSPEDSLVFFIIRLLDRLRAMGTAPAIDWSQYFK